MTTDERAELRRRAEAFAETNIVDLSRAAMAYFDALGDPAKVLALLDALDAAEQRSTELAARLETAEKDTRRMDALETAQVFWDGFSGEYESWRNCRWVCSRTLRYLADALEVDA